MPTHFAQQATQSALALAGTAGFLALIIVSGFIVYRIGRRIITRAAAPEYVRRGEAFRRLQSTRSLLVQGWRLLVVAGMLLAALTRLPGGVIPTTAVATALAFTLGFGITVPLLKDLFPGVNLKLEAQFIPGDRVKLQGVDDAEGVVESAGLRVTVLRRDDGSRVFVPNGLITAVENFTATGAWEETTELRRVSAELAELASTTPKRAPRPSGTSTGHRRRARQSSPR